MNKKWLVSIIVLLAAAGGVAAFFVRRAALAKKNVRHEEIVPSYGSIRETVATTGDVKPQNRLEIKPPIAGRIDKIAVEEGDKVKAGQILGTMSSTERAALLDAALARSAEEVKYWQEVYKATPLIAPMGGEVIVRAVEPGQTVTPSVAVIVLSDCLIVRADVDETDVGKVRVGQTAEITLEAYPEIRVPAKVTHVSYESKVVSNVTVYEVELLPETVPDVFRSGMSARVTILRRTKENILLVPEEAVVYEKDGPVVTVKASAGHKPEKRKVSLGITDGKNVEITAGLTEGDVVLVEKNDFSVSQLKKPAESPFLPARRRKSK